MHIQDTQNEHTRILIPIFAIQLKYLLSYIVILIIINVQSKIY